MVYLIFFCRDLRVWCSTSTGADMDRQPNFKSNLSDRTENDPVANTVAFWKQHSGVEVSPDDAREMVESVVGFFSLLAEWESAVAADGSTSVLQGNTTKL